MRYFNLLKTFYSITYFKSGIIKASQNTIFRVISQTQYYSDFVPFIEKSVVKKISHVQNQTQLTISYNNFKSLSYTSHVKIQRGDAESKPSIIHSICKEEPLKQLDSLWVIAGRGEKCSFVQYKLEFQFNSLMYTLGSSILKDYLGIQMWNIFESESIKKEDQNQITQRKTRRQKQVLRDGIKKEGEQITKLVESTQINAEGRLQLFLKQNPQINRLYNSNTQFKGKVLKIHARLAHLEAYSRKMKHQVNNLLTHF